MEESDASGSADWRTGRRPATTVRLCRDDIARIEVYTGRGFYPSLSRFVAEAIRDV